MYFLSISVGKSNMLVSIVLMPHIVAYFPHTVKLGEWGTGNGTALPRDSQYEAAAVRGGIFYLYVAAMQERDIFYNRESQA